MAGLKTIYARDGTPIADIRASVTRSWLLNDIGQAQFSISVTDPKCTEEILQFGNWLYVQHDTLPDWVGIIDIPRSWHNGYVDVTAYEMPYLLHYRIPQLNNVLTGSAGQIFLQILAQANTAENTGIIAGDVFLGGTNRQETMNDTAYVHIGRIQSRSGNDWMIRPVVNANGQLSVYMDWLEKAGLESDIELSQGKNIQYGDTPLEESGELLNEVIAVADAQDAGERASVTIRDQPSVSAFGLRQALRTYTGTTDPATLEANARTLIAASKSPDISTGIVTVDKADTFRNMRLGNIHDVRYSNVGFSDGGLGATLKIRVMGMRFDEKTGTLELVLGKV